MNRHVSTQAVVLKSVRMGEMHRLVTLLSPELGVFQAAAFGARKGSGKLTGLLEPFSSGTLYVYHNPVKQQYKIEDMNVDEFREGIRNSLRHVYAASFFAELVMKSYGSGGEHESSYRLLLSLYDALCTQEDLDPILIQGCWRFLAILGLTPDVHYCASCGKELGREAAVLNLQDHGLWCTDCLPVHSSDMVMDAGARNYLRYTGELPLEKALPVRVSSVERLKRILLGYIDVITEERLKTLRSGML